MKLSDVTYLDVEKAAHHIDFSGIPKGSINNHYWVVVNNKEYPFKHLTNKAYQIAKKTNENLNFQSNDGYRNFIESLGFKFNFYVQNLNFFKDYEIESYISVARKPYRKNNGNDVKNSILIQPCVKKLNYWASNSLIEDFEAKLDNTWQWSGTFKSYLWIRIYRKNSSKKVYFVLGINEEGKLYIHLNCQRSNHTGGKTKPLSPTIITLFDKYLNDADYSPKSIIPSNLMNYNWDSLIDLTQNYFYKYATLYDELESLSKEKKPLELVQSYILFPGDVPDETKSYITNDRNFKGKKIDWSKKQFASSKLGLLGEELVLHIEKLKLKDLGLNDKIEQVEKKLDGEGYDILSFDNDGNEMYIEVKTTKGNSDEPFYLSANEMAFCDLNKDKYVIYRLYNYNYQFKTANYYIISSSEISNFDLKPTNYEVSKSLK